MRAFRIILPALLIMSLMGCQSKPKVPIDPKIQTQSLMDTFHKEDWKSLYSLIAVSPKNKADMKGADKFAEDAKKGMATSPNAAIVHELFSSMTNIKVGDATVNGTKATVPTFCTVTVQGHTVNFEGQANLALDDGEWKWDLTGADDIEAETAKQTQALLGKPKT